MAETTISFQTTNQQRRLIEALAVRRNKRSMSALIKSLIDDAVDADLTPEFRDDLLGVESKPRTVTDPRATYTVGQSRKKSGVKTP